jgi:hypothetical protein
MFKIKLNTEWNRIPVLERYVVSSAGCWEWQGYILNSGYGHVQVDKRRYSAHRYFWQELVGPIPDGLILCHHCDNPRCVNPAHIFVGTHLDNSLDCSQKGRRNPPRKLTEEEVVAIFTDPRVTREIAADYGVTAGNISCIQTGKTWRRFTSKIGEIRPRRKTGPRPKLKSPTAAVAG